MPLVRLDKSGSWIQPSQMFRGCSLTLLPSSFVSHLWHVQFFMQENSVDEARQQRVGQPEYLWGVAAKWALCLGYRASQNPSTARPPFHLIAWEPARQKDDREAPQKGRLGSYRRKKKSAGGLEVGKILKGTKNVLGWWVEGEGFVLG